MGVRVTCLLCDAQWLATEAPACLCQGDYARDVSR
jgi:hypothetical protein